MSWVRLDDAIAEHRKVVALEDYEAPCCWLNVKALAWSNRQLADGLVPKAVVRRLASTFLGRLRMGQQVLTADDLMSRLIMVGLWIDEGDSIRVHDYLQYQPSRASIEEKRAKDAERKRDGRHATSARSPRGVHADIARTPSGQPPESEPPDPIRSDPARSVPDCVVSLPPRGGHRIPQDHPLEAATREIYLMRACKSPPVCHGDFVEQKRASGEMQSDWHAAERRWAQRHDERALCHRRPVKASSSRDLAAENRERRERAERERQGAAS